jgi:PAS domain-containing protein
MGKEARKSERVQMGVEIIFGGQKHFITSDRQQILDLLISTYDVAVQKNIELTKVRDELSALNEHLEELVEERTTALTAEIAELKQTEIARRESEERFWATFEQAAVGLAHVGLDGRWLRVNQKLCDIVGYTRPELLEKTSQEITLYGHYRLLGPNSDYSWYCLRNLGDR